jgi:hypothetical protein
MTPICFVQNNSTEENMTKYLAAALLTTALFTGAASAQTSTANKAAAADSAAATHREGEWRASKLAGINVYNEANEKIAMRARPQMLHPRLRALPLRTAGMPTVTGTPITPSTVRQRIS